MSRRRVQIDMTETDVEIMAELREAFDTTTHAETVRRALKYAREMTRIKAEGLRHFVGPDEDHITKEIILL